MRFTKRIPSIFMKNKKRPKSQKFKKGAIYNFNEIPWIIAKCESGTSLIHRENITGIITAAFVRTINFQKRYLQLGIIYV